MASMGTDLSVPMDETDDLALRQLHRDGDELWRMWEPVILQRIGGRV
jgi:hypothetical protein